MVWTLYEPSRVLLYGIDSGRFGDSDGIPPGTFQHRSYLDDNKRRCKRCGKLAGSLYASFVQYINASNFSINVSINIVAMVAIGGMGTISGPILGAVLLQVLPEAIRFLDNYRQLLFGAALVISVMFAPKGLVGLNWRKIRLIDRICARFESGKEE